MTVPVIADTKQAFGAFALAGLAMMFLYVDRGTRMVAHARFMILGLLALGLIAQTQMPHLELIFDAAYLREGILHKIEVFPRMVSHYDSRWDWVFGLGPGHTIGRLGWLIPSYEAYLAPLGVTTSPATMDLLRASNAHWIAGTSLWSFAFSWAGIWGDLGILGLLVMVVLWLTTVRELCKSSASVFLVLSVLVFGFVHAWMEEPGYMLFVVTVLGLLWQSNPAARMRTLRTVREPSGQASLG